MEVLERAEVPNDLTAAVEKNDYVHVAAYLQSHPCLDLSATLKVIAVNPSLKDVPLGSSLRDQRLASFRRR